MFPGRKLFHALLGASLAAAVVAGASTAQAAYDDPPKVGDKPAQCVGTAPSPSVGATKILLAGDSIVHESRGDWTWRYFLWKHLNPNPATAVNYDFVGDYNWLIDPDSSKWPYCDYQDPAFDTDFTATPGRKLADYNVVGQTPGGVPYIQYEVQHNQASVLVMLAGANDLAKGATAAETLTEAHNLVLNARAGNSTVKVVLVAAPTGGPYDQYADSDYNAQLKAAAPGWSTAASPVVVTDPMTNWGTSARNWDDIHPNVVGEQVIASGIADALSSPALGIGTPGTGVDPNYKIGLRNPVTDVVASLNGSNVHLTWTLPVGASGAQILAQDTTDGVSGRPWVLVKDMAWRPFDNTVGCTNPNYDPNPFSTTYDPNSTIPCLKTDLPISASSGLVPGHSYNIAMHSEKGTAVATDLFSNIETITLPGAIVLAKPVVGAPVAGVHAVTVNWAAVAAANGPYKVRWHVVGSSTYGSTTAPSTTRSISGLVAGVKYGFQVAAVRNGVAGPWSDEKVGIPKAGAIGAVAKPVLKQVAGPKVKVTWKKTVGATRYLLQFHQVGKAWRNVAYFTTTTYTSVKLAKKKSYEYRVVPYDGYVAGHVSAAARIKTK